MSEGDGIFPVFKFSRTERWAQSVGFSGQIRREDDEFECAIDTPSVEVASDHLVGAIMRVRLPRDP